MAFTVIPNSDIDPGSPITTGLMTALRDNDDFLLAQTKGLVLIEKKIITADTNLVTFSGLNGEADEVYRIIARIVNTGAPTVEYTLEPNGIASSQISITSLISAASISSTGTGNLLLARDSTASSGVITFDATFWARKDVNGVGTRRHLTSLWNAFRVEAGQVAGEWNETTTTVTSLDIVTTSSEIRDGSTIALYKMRQS